MDFNKNLPHKTYIGNDTKGFLKARRVFFHIFDANGTCYERYFQPREVGAAFLLNRIEEMFEELQKRNPHYESYTYTIHDLEDKQLTENCSNPLTPLRIGKKKFLDNIKKRGGGLYFHDKPGVNQIDTF